MKKLFPVILFSLFALVACSDDDHDNVPLNNAVIEFINDRYQGAKIRSSEYESHGLLEVEIFHEGKVKDVYFNSQSNWLYTSWDVRRADIPSVVKSAVSEAYPGYGIDEVDFVERETISYYAVEVQKGNAEIMVYVSPDGEILESSVGGSSTKPVLSDAVRSFIDENYPGARIVSYEYDANGLLNVEIVDGIIEKDVYFDNNDNWVQTDWDVSAERLPDAVLQALANAYPHYVIDSADFVQRPGGVEYYEIELEKAGGAEIVVKVTADGEIL